jgi:preprotein translocase subunit YajC
MAAPIDDDALAAETTAPPPGQGPGGEAPPAGMGGLFANPLLWLVIVVWLLVLWSMRKQKKKEADRKSELDALRKGDKVVTIGRLHGTVTALDDDTFTIKTDEKGSASLTFDRVALHKILPRGGEEKKDADAAS